MLSALALIAAWATGTTQALPLPRAGVLPFAQPLMGLADSGETLVAYRHYIGGGHWALEAALGIPGATFASPQTLARDDVVLRGVAMDSAGDALVVWDKAIPPAQCDARFSCDPSDVQLFAAVRKAGGAFGDAQLVAHENPHSTRPPLVAGSRHGGYAVVYSCLDHAACVLAGAAGSFPTAPQPLDAANFTPMSAGVDDGGNVTVGGDVFGRATTVVWHPDGTTASPQTLDPVRDGGSSPVRAISVGGAGQAVAGWSHSGFASPSPGTYASVRSAGGAFGGPLGLHANPTVVSPEVGIDAQGRAVATWWGRAGGFDAVVAVAESTPAGPFGEPATISPPHRALQADPQLAVAPDGSAGVVWLDSAGPLDAQHARAAFRRGTASFGPAIGLSDSDQEAPDPPQVALDANGRAVVAWTSVAGTEQRLLVEGFGPGGVTSATTVARGPAPPLQPPAHFRPFADVGVGQLVHMRRNGRIYPNLVCVSPAGVSCRGTVRVRTRLIRGEQRRYTVSSRGFVLRHGEHRRVAMKVFRSARHALRRRSLDCTITTTTRSSLGGDRTNSEELFVAKTPRRQAHPG